MKDNYKLQPAVILAGGESRRMKGSDKGELRIVSDRLVDIVHSNVQAQIKTVHISGRHDYGLDVKVIPDFGHGPKGPLAGLYACCDYFAKSRALGFFTVPIDGPHFPLDLFEQLFSVSHSTVARDGDQVHPVYAWWRIEDLQNFWPDLASGKSSSLKSLMEECGAVPVTWNEKHVFKNINTPEDFNAYVKTLNL